MKSIYTQPALQGVSFYSATHKTPFLLSLCLLFVLPWRDAVVLIESGSITIGWMVGFLFGISWVISKMISGELLKPTNFHIIYFVFVAWAGLSSVWAIETGSAVGELIRLGYVGLVMVAFWDVYTNQFDPIIGFQAFLFGLSVVVYSTVGDFVVTGSTYRPGGLGLNPNLAGMLMTFGIPIAYQYISTRPQTSRVLKFINICYIPLAIFGIFLTGSRGSMLAMLVVIGSLMMVTILGQPSQHSGRVTCLQKTAIFSALIGMVPVIVSLTPTRTWERITEIPQLIRNVDLDNRADIWYAGAEVMRDNLILGIGGNNFQEAVGITAHNTYLSIQVELGIIGLTLFSLLLVSVIQCVFSSQNKNAWAALMMGWATAAFFNTFTFLTSLIMFNLIVIESFSTELERQGEHYD